MGEESDGDANLLGEDSDPQSGPSGETDEPTAEADPEADGPDADDPDAESPDAESPDAESPDAESPDAESPDASESGEPPASPPETAAEDGGTPPADPPAVEPETDAEPADETDGDDAESDGDEAEGDEAEDGAESEEAESDDGSGNLQPVETPEVSLDPDDLDPDEAGPADPERREPPERPDPPEGVEPPEPARPPEDVGPADVEPPDRARLPEGADAPGEVEPPEDVEPPDGAEPPEGAEPPGESAPLAENAARADSLEDVAQRSEPLEDEEMPLADHIEEMLKRLAVVLVVAGVVSLAVLPFSETVINFLWNSILPAGETTRPRLYGPLALVLTKLKVASLAGLVIALPVLVYETYQFMRPGLYPHERRYYLAAVPTSLVLAFVGISFAYFLILPVIFEYFLYYSEDVTTIAFALTKTFNLILLLMGYLAIVFQIPLFIMLAIMMGLTTRRWLVDRRLYFWGAFLGIAFLFSPDPTGMAPIMVATTMVALFEGTLFLLKWTGR